MTDKADITPGAPVNNSTKQLRGVAMNAPPPEIMGSIMAEIDKAIATLPPDKNGALLIVADLSGANATLVTRGPLGTEVQAWFGKTWHGPIEGGVRVLKTF